jgi:polyisoprenyl-phosphate glycosyltransferase
MKDIKDSKIETLNLFDIYTRHDFFQGGGGNVSVKIDQNHMVVKASGVRMKDIENFLSVVEVDYSLIQKSLLNQAWIGSEMSETAYDDIVGAAVQKNNQKQRPSMETGFHVFLGKAVLHSHSVYTHVFVSAIDGQAMCKKMFQNFSLPVHWIAYAKPGLALSQAFATLSLEQNLTTGSHVFFLENHGLVVSASSMEEAVMIHDEVHKVIENLWDFNSYPSVDEFKSLSNEFLSTNPYLLDNKNILSEFPNNISVPDQAVYGAGEQWSLDFEQGEVVYHTQSQKAAIATEEMLLSHVYMRVEQARFGLKTQSLSEGDVWSLLDMESEKYRQNIMQNTQTNPMCTIVIPCYNESKNIPIILEGFASVIDRDDIEVILVDNNSTDDTASVIAEYIPSYAFAKAIKEKKKGYGNAILAGLRIAKGEYIGWTHGDMQTPPKDVVRAIEMIENLGKPKDIYVKGNRKGRPLFDQLFTFGMSVFESLYLRAKLFDINAQPNIFHKSFFATWDTPPGDFSLDLYALYLAKRAKMQVIRIPVRFPKRIHGTSTWDTGLASKWKFIKRTMKFSFELKQKLS